MSINIMVEYKCDFQIFQGIIPVSIYTSKTYGDFWDKSSFPFCFLFQEIYWTISFSTVGTRGGFLAE